MILIFGSSGTVGSEVIRQLEASGVPFRRANREAPDFSGVDKVFIVSPGDAAAEIAIVEQAKRAADAFLVRRQQEAQATLAEKSAVAQGIRKERAALNGSAGDAYVSLQLIEALQKKEIRQIPKLPNGNVIIDGNKLLQQLGDAKLKQLGEFLNASKGPK